MTTATMSRPSPAQYAASATAPVGVRHRLIAEPEFELHHNRFPAARSQTDGIGSHGISLHCSPSARYISRVEGRRSDARAAAGISSILPAGMPFDYEWADPVELLLLWITPSLWERVLRDSVPGGEIELEPRTHVDDPLVGQIAQALKRGAELGQPFGRLLRDSLVVTLVAHIASRQTARVETAGPRGGLVDWRLRRVLEHMDEHLTDDVALADLAGLAGLSEHHFSKAFRQTMGEPPHRYLVQRRISRAKSMFADDRERSVTQVAMAVGFTTSTHFATMFRKVTGGTPSAYRQSL